MKNIIEVKNLSKKYGQFTALSNINLSIPAGKIVGLIGPNGAGKTSFLKILSGLMLGSSGNVIIDGVDLSSNPDLAQKKIAFMLENNPLSDHMRVGEYLRFRAELKGIKNVRKSVESIMRKCDLYYDARYRVIRTLSKGYRQRIGIADALLGDQPVVILDEPTIGLDPRQIIGIRKTIQELCQSKTLIISSHILSELETICDYYIMINEGQVMSCGAFDAITEQNKNFEYYADISSSCSEVDLTDFLISNKLDYFIKPDNKKNIYHVSFRSSNALFQKIIHIFVDHFGEYLISIGKEHYSLEDIFLHATKRSHDNN